MKRKVLSFMSFCILIFIMFSNLSFAADNRLKNGEYTVKIKLWHSTDDRESMAASAFYEDAKIVVSDNIMTMYVDTKSINISGLTASLQEMEVSDENGKYIYAYIEEKDSSGNPTKFSFTLPHMDEYLNVKVNPKVILMANQAISARIKIDYDSLKKLEDKIITEKQMKIIEKSTSKTVETTAPETTEKLTERETENSTTTTPEISDDTSTATTRPYKIDKRYNKAKIKVAILSVVVLTGAITVGIFIIIKNKKE